MTDVSNLILAACIGDMQTLLCQDLSPEWARLTPSKEIERLKLLRKRIDRAIWTETNCNNKNKEEEEKSMKWFEIMNAIKEVDCLMAHTPHSPAERTQRNKFVREQLDEIVTTCYKIMDDLTREDEEIDQIESMPKTATQYVSCPMNEKEWE